MPELLAAACLILGAWCVLGAVIALVRGARSRSWPTAQGVIRSARILEKFNSHADLVRRQELEYSYVVNGKKYRSSRIRFGVPGFAAWAPPSAHTFRVGEHVPVFHSAASPAVSALQPGIAPFVFLQIAVGGIVAVTGLRMLLS